MWVRSQDKLNLLRVSDLVIVGNSIRECYGDESSLRILGEYKTDERALEVLYDIQQFINQQIDFERNCQFTTARHPEISNVPKSFIFQMPKS